MEFKNGSTASVKYTYDKNGNLTQDLNKGIRKIAYNSRNLPERIEFTNTKMIHYTYDAAGTKRRVVHQNGSDTPMKQYCENKVYDGTTLTMIMHETGYLTKENGTWKYFYYLKDHVGSNRLVLDDQGGVVQINNYYPYGLTQAEPTPRTDQAEQPYKFGGKELDRDFGVDVYDFEARMYNPAIGRFMQPDPLAEKYYSVSPYAYCLNNPIKYVDPTGMYPIYDEDGNFLGTDEHGLQGHAYIMNKDNFKQGMSLSDVHKNMSKLNDGDEVRARFNESYNSLSSRPDYDGEITLDEANEWFRNGNGQPLFADLSKLDLSAITTSDFSQTGETKPFNLLFYGNKKDGLVYGTINLTYTGMFDVTSSHDDYDFDIRAWNSIGNIVRNTETVIGNWVAGSGTGYRINFYGKGKISPTVNRQQVWPERFNILDLLK